MKQNRKILFFVINWLIYIGFIQNFIFDNIIFTIVPDILIFYVAYRTGQKKNRLKSSINKYVGKFLPGLIKFAIVFTVAGFLINSLSPLSYLWGVRNVIRYPILVWVIYRNFEMADVRKYKKYIYMGFDINMLFCAMEFLAGIRGDPMGGTFEGNSLLMLYALIVMILATGDYFRKRVSVIRFVAYIFCMLIIAILAEIKMIYFLFPLTIYGCYVLNKKFNLSHIIVLILAFFFLIPAMQFVMSFYYGSKYVNQTFDMAYLQEETSHSYDFREGGFNRATAIDLTNKVILTDPVHLVFGYGLGSGSISRTFSTDLLEKYRHTMFWNFTTSYALVELGWSGFCLYALCYLLFLWRFYRIYSKYKDKEIKYWAAIGVVSVGVTFIMCWYNDSPYVKYLMMYVLWGVCLSAIEARKKEIGLQ